jgi:hypothetical protein
MLARLPRMPIALLLVLALAAVAVVAGMRSAASEAALDEERQARAEFARDMGELRRSLSVPAQDARTATSALRTNLAELVTGSDRDLSTVAYDRASLVESLREAADELEANSEVDAPDGHEELPGDTVEPALRRLDGLDEQTRRVASQLRTAADETEQWADTAEELLASAEALLALDAPQTDDPDALAGWWREELETLAPYREAAENAAEHEDLAALGEAHLQLVEGLETVAELAVTRLEEGDVDGYNELLGKRIADEDPFGFNAALDEAVEQTLTRGPVAEIEDAQERTLGLLAEIDKLRRVTPSRSVA